MIKDMILKAGYQTQGKGVKTRPIPVIDEEFLSDLRHLPGNWTATGSHYQQLSTLPAKLAVEL